jgi:transposase
MIRSPRSPVPRLLLAAVAALALLAVAGCASDDDTRSTPPTTTTAASQQAPASAASADASKLDAADAGTLLTVRRTVARYCDGHKASAGELTGAVATLESLYEIDPDARQADGTTVGEAAKAIERKLRACHAGKAARRVAKLTD